MKKRVYLSIALVVAFPLLSYGQAWSLDKCIDYAIDHNHDILHKQFQYEAQNEILSATAGKRMPVISFGTQQTFHAGNTLILYGVDENVTMSLTQIAATMEMPVLTGGSLPNSKAAEQYALKAAGENIAVSKINMKIKVAAAYMQLLNDKSQEQIALEQVHLCERHLENVTKLVNEGKKTNIDLAEARSSLSSSEYVYTEARGVAVISKIALVNLIGLDDEAGFEIEELYENVENGQKSAGLSVIENIDSHPVVMSARYNLASAEYREKAAKGAMYPQMSLFANYNNYFYFPFGVKGGHIGSQLGSNGWGAVGFKLFVPILDNGIRKQRERAKIAISDAKVMLDESRMEVSKQIRESYYQTVTAKDRYVSAMKAESAAVEAYNCQQKMYDAGRSTTFDLDQSRIKWFVASEEAVRAKYEYILRSKIFEYYSSYTKD